MGKELVEAIVNIRDDDALRLVREVISKREDAESVLYDCHEAMKIIKERYEKSEYSMAELFMSGETIKNISGILGVTISEEDLITSAMEKAKSSGKDDACSSCC
ncbi:MAG: B12-binding domain-containing protein [Chloroflexi bacterium]|nr:B12-binding domain-containing protein [Chloroflexota bacterium]